MPVFLPPQITTVIRIYVTSNRKGQVGFACSYLSKMAVFDLVKMAWQLKTKAGRKHYGRRKCTVEPVFGIIKHIMGFRQFSRRGLDAVAGEWKWVTLAFNLKRMHVLSYA
jgi:hypothetical protein